MQIPEALLCRFQSSNVKIIVTFRRRYTLIDNHGAMTLEFTIQQKKTS